MPGSPKESSAIRIYSKRKVFFWKSRQQLQRWWGNNICESEILSHSDLAWDLLGERAPEGNPVGSHPLQVHREVSTQRDGQRPRHGDEENKKREGDRDI